MFALTLLILKNTFEFGTVCINRCNRQRIREQRAALLCEIVATGCAPLFPCARARARTVTEFPNCVQKLLSHFHFINQLKSYQNTSNFQEHTFFTMFQSTTFLDTLKSYIKWKTINNLWTKFDHSCHRARANAIEFSLLTGLAGLLSRGLLFHISAHSALLTGKTLTFWGFNVRSQGQIHFWVGLLNVAALLVCSSLQGIFFTMGFESFLKVSLHFN